MEAFFLSGSVANLILVIMAIEVAAFGFFLWKRNQGLWLLSYVATTLAGGSLVLALRAALLGQGWLLVAIYVTASLLAHLVDLAIRFAMAGEKSETL